MDDNERWADEMFRAKPEAIRAPAGFTDRVMARVTAADPRLVPAWLLAASDPVAAVGLTIALVLALLASWWPERLLGGAALLEAWLWNRATDIARDVDRAVLLTLIAMGSLLVLFVAWRTWRATERALVLALAGRPRT
ncbi:MAG TPA: hypothetical protein VJX91_06260 [Candidatus Eisenbacteria bacterium]|nr:hypothetical protein [Candidatus Eisenbacteria bacterium]